jgi:hypothetical protein
LSNWAIYKRFQRLENTRQQLEACTSDKNESTVMTSITPRQESNWTDVALGFGILMSILAGILYYRYQQNNSQIKDSD